MLSLAGLSIRVYYGYDISVVEEGEGNACSSNDDFLFTREA